MGRLYVTLECYENANVSVCSIPGRHLTPVYQRLMRHFLFFQGSLSSTACHQLTRLRRT